MSTDLTVAVLIASKDGSAIVADTIRSVADQCPVYVVSDGSGDDTAEVARNAGATVLDLTVNVGKPAALYTACRELGLLDRYDILAILDDDTTVEPDFIANGVAAFGGRSSNIAIVVGRTNNSWADSQRWNPWVAARAYTYWRYQVALRRGQSAVNALNCISGSNSLYRTEVLKEVLVRDTPYIVDDTFWTLETHRKELGRIIYEPTAHAWIQDPTTFKDWYKQNLRWLWGTMQGVVGHKVGRRNTWFDFWYVGLIIDWMAYLFLWPVLFIMSVQWDWIPVANMAMFMAASYAAWLTAAAISLKKPRLILFAPFIVIFDWIYRINFIHAIYKTIKEPTVEDCRWESPTRYENQTQGA